MSTAETIAGSIESDMEQTARRSRWADPTTLHFMETANDGVFEVYAEGPDGDMHLLDITDVGSQVEETDEPSPRKKHKRMVRNVEHDPERAYKVLDSIVRYLPGMRTQYIHDDRMIVAQERGAPRMNRMPAGASPGMLDEYEWERLRNEVEMQATAMAKTAAILGKNAVVVDTEMDTMGQVNAGMHGWNHVLNVPLDILRDDYDVNPREVLVVEESEDEALFVADGEYYFRGTNEEVVGYGDGWLTQLSRPADSIEEVKSEHIKPDSVQAAEGADLTVKRQGDWFFVEQHDDFMPTGVTRTPELQPEGEDPFLQNHAAEFLGHDALNPSRTFVKGSVDHMTDDHSTLRLPGGEWFEAVHNGIESTSFECEQFEMDRNRGRTFSHPESTGGLL